MTDIFKRLSEIARENPKGFTYCLKTNGYVLRGYISASNETQNCFGSEGLRKCINHSISSSGGGIVGGWYNTDNKRYYFDSCFKFSSLEKAKQFAKKQGQIAIFDLYRMEEIRL